MSAAFQSMLQQDAVNILSGKSDFGEQVIYQDKGGNEYTFTTNVYRDQPGTISDTRANGTPGKPAPRLAAWCPLDPNAQAGDTNGIPNRPDRGGLEKIYVSDVNGGAPAWHQVTEILLNSAGGWMVGCR